MYTSAPYSATFSITEQSAGWKSYTCSYTCNVNGTIVESDKSAIVQIQIVDRPEEPLLSPDRPDNVYVSGEFVTFTCRPPQARYSINGFLLYKDGQRVSIEPKYNSAREEVTFKIAENSAGSKYYVCSYTRKLLGRIVESHYSTSVRIKAVGRPEKPLLSPDRTDKVYVSDERITFTCTSPKLRESISSFLLYKGRERASTQPRYTSGRYIATFPFWEIGTGSKSYTCSYTCHVLGRTLESHNSTTVWIDLVGRPEKPLLSPDRTDKVYVSDERITFTCTSPKLRESISSFLLYKGRERASTQPRYTSGRYIATFPFWEIGTGSKSYTCSYTWNVLGRTLESHNSTTVWIDLVGRPEKPLLSPDRTDKVYVSDERITFTCTSPQHRESISSFLLYKGRERASTQPRYTSGRYIATFPFWEIGTGSKSYTCSYTWNVLGRTLESHNSTTVWIDLVARPQEPRISSNRPDKIYVSDESVILTCQTTGRVHSGGKFQLYNSRQLVNEKLSQRDSATFTIANRGDAPRDYYCVYTCMVSGRGISSRQSNTLTITVVARPQEPRISSNRPDKIYVSDESVILTCQTTGRVHSGGKFQLYNSRQLVNEELSQRDSATFTIANRGDAPRDYYCVYTCMVSGRSISSRQSNTLTITVVDLPRPIISLASGYIAQGENVMFNCTSRKKISVGTFYLYKNGVRLNDTVLQSTDAQNQSATFTIQNVEPGNSGNYTCGYQLLDGDRYLMSSHSNPVLLSLNVKSILPWIPVFPVVTLILMLRVLGVYCWNKGQLRLLSSDRMSISYGKKETFQAQGDDRMGSADLKL
ncbi:uncharacterized protein LOC132387153 [Hypanus sabinus]|uniref:uncharacterized protein LOC132387153 n=1 Tax=Hypanus sabinus TaxID=79690 RepID=UPI0028C4789C|nr:uncharacterized protein LOC132387153 [Hypanus sabinus]